MQKIKLIIAMFLVLATACGVYYFAFLRNGQRKVERAIVAFSGNKNLFISREAVSKLLIQKKGGVQNVTKEVLDLNTLESALNSNPMIENAQVSLSVNGTISAKVKQKQPIARVITNTSYYIDSQGKYMPLSSSYTERVPIVTGYVYKDELENVHTLVSKILDDEFLTKNVVEIHQNKNQTFTLRLRQCDFSVFFGKLNNIEKKINNLKAFYIKASKDKLFNKYSKVNLQFDNQVVCTKV